MATRSHPPARARAARSARHRPARRPPPWRGRGSPRAAARCPCWRPRRRRARGTARRPGAVSASSVSAVTDGASRSISMADASTPSTPVDRGVDQREAVGRRRHHPAPLLPRITGDDQQHPVEAELRPRLGRDDHVPDVHRVERAPEHPQPLARIGRSGSLRAHGVFTSAKHSRHHAPYHRSRERRPPSRPRTSSCGSGSPTVPVRSVSSRRASVRSTATSSASTCSSAATTSPSTSSRCCCAGRSRSTCSSARSRRSTARASRRCARSTTSPTRGSTRSSRPTTLCAAEQRRGAAPDPRRADPRRVPRRLERAARRRRRCWRRPAR